MDREVWVRYNPDDTYEPAPVLYECEPGVFVACLNWVQLEWSESLGCWFGALHDRYFMIPWDSYEWSRSRPGWRSNKLGDCSMYATDLSDFLATEPVGVSLMDLLEEE